MEKGLADVRQDLEISKQRFWTQQEDSIQEGGGSCEGTDGANIRGGQVSPVPWHGGQWGNRPLLSTSSLVSKIYTKQLPREKKKNNPKQQKLFPFLPNSKVSLFTLSSTCLILIHFPWNTWLCLALSSTSWLKSKMLSFLLSHWPGEPPKGSIMNCLIWIAKENKHISYY